MPNNNVTGKNGSGEKKIPPDDVLNESLQQYAREGLKRVEKLSRLQKEHGLSIGRTKLNQLEKKFQIPSVRKPLPAEIATQHVINEAEKDINQLNGPNYIKDKLKDRGIMVPRDTVRQVMHEQFPAGFDKRYPGSNKRIIHRSPLDAIGTYHEVSGDGHEKLGALALRLGDVGLPIYGFKDKWSDYLLMLKVVPNCRTAGSLAHLYLDLIEQIGGIPLQLTTDKGSETGWLYAIQVALRQVFAEQIDPNVYPEYMFLKSVHNTVIEGFWRWLREKVGINLKEIICRGRTGHYFNPVVVLHKDVFNWLFPPLLQRELDGFREWWNQHRVRPQAEKTMPSGHVPANIMANPEHHAGLDCLIKIAPEVVMDLREYANTEVGPRSDHLRWVSSDFEDRANAAYEALDSPSITWSTCWTVFSQMVNVLEEM